MCCCSVVVVLRLDARWLFFVVRRLLFGVVYCGIVVVRCLLALGVVRWFVCFVAWYVLLVLRYVLVVWLF